MIDPKLLKIRLISHGLKTDLDIKSGDPIIPKADLYIDCRIVHEEGLSGTGHHQEFQDEVVKQSSTAMGLFERLILESFDTVETRRKGVDPYQKPWTICFMCAWGVHRSVSTKYIMFDRLRQKGLQVSVLD